MSTLEILEAVEQTILNRSLNSSEREVLLLSLQGQSYDDIAQNASYVKGYLKVLGAKLWQELSTKLGEKVTKKNVYPVLSEYLQSQNGQVFQPGKSTVKESTCLDQSEVSVSTSVLEGPIPLDSPLYVERPPLESLAYQEIARPGCLLRIKAPRKYGKSSLLLRLTTYCHEIGLQPVMLDFQEADKATLRDLDRLLRWLCLNIMQQLQLPNHLDEIWDTGLGSKVSFKAFLHEQVLAPAALPIVLVLNEVNQVFESFDVAQDFLPMIRSCYEQAQSSAIWKKLRLVMAYSTDVYVPLQLNQSPFNVGISLIPKAFTHSQATDLARRYGLHDLGETQLLQLMDLLGGHPYLINRAFHALGNQQMPFAQFLQMAPTPAGIYGVHLHHHLTVLLEHSSLIEALEAVLNNEAGAQIHPIAAYKLASVGLVKLEGYQARVSCHLYRYYFERVLTQLNLPA